MNKECASVGIYRDALKAAKAYKEVTGLSMSHFVSDAVWEKIGHLPPEQRERVKKIIDKKYYDEGR